MWYLCALEALNRQQVCGTMPLILGYGAELALYGHDIGIVTPVTNRVSIKTYDTHGSGEDQLRHASWCMLFSAL